MLNPETVDRHIAAWYEVRLGDTARAVADECNLYCGAIEVLSDVPEFDDEPSDFRHALAGRRGWRGKVR